MRGVEREKGEYTRGKRLSRLRFQRWDSSRNVKGVDGVKG